MAADLDPKVLDEEGVFATVRRGRTRSTRGAAMPWGLACAAGGVSWVHLRGDPPHPQNRPCGQGERGELAYHRQHSIVSCAPARHALRESEVVDEEDETVPMRCRVAQATTCSEGEGSSLQQCNVLRNEEATRIAYTPSLCSDASRDLREIGQLLEFPVIPSVPRRSDGPRVHERVAERERTGPRLPLLGRQATEPPPLAPLPQLPDGGGRQRSFTDAEACLAGICGRDDRMPRGPHVTNEERQHGRHVLGLQGDRRPGPAARGVAVAREVVDVPHDGEGLAPDQDGRDEVAGDALDLPS